MQYFTEAVISWKGVRPLFHVSQSFPPENSAYWMKPNAHSEVFWDEELMANHVPMLQYADFDIEAKHKEEKDALHNKIDQLIDKVGNRTTNITNNTQNIILNNYGNEDMSHITNDIKTNLLKIPFAMIPKMIEAVHFNDEKPENKNILLPNKKDNLVKIFKENKWIHLNKDDVIKLLVSEKYNILDKHFENKHKNKIEELKELQEFWKENYVNFRKIYSNGNKELIDKITNECELVLLNNR